MESQGLTLSDFGQRPQKLINLVAQIYNERTGHITNLGKRSAISFSDIASFIQGKRIICGFDSDGDCEILNKKNNPADFDDIIIILGSIMLNRTSIKNSVFDEAFVNDFFDTIEEFTKRHGIDKQREIA